MGRSDGAIFIFVALYHKLRTANAALACGYSRSRRCRFCYACFLAQVDNLLSMGCGNIKEGNDVALPSDAAVAGLFTQDFSCGAVGVTNDYYAVIIFRHR